MYLFDYLGRIICEDVLLTYIPSKLQDALRGLYRAHPQGVYRIDDDGRPQRLTVVSGIFVFDSIVLDRDLKHKMKTINLLGG